MIRCCIVKALNMDLARTTLSALVQAEARLSVHLAVIILAAHLHAEIENLRRIPRTYLRHLELLALRDLALHALRLLEHRAPTSRPPMPRTTRPRTPRTTTSRTPRTYLETSNSSHDMRAR